MPKIEIDSDKCIGCGACASLCPEVFQLEEGKSKVINSEGCDKCDCQETADSCPVEAIILNE